LIIYYLYEKELDMSDQNSDYNYFDESTSILAPALMAVIIVVIGLVLFLP